ncbi:MAG: hypothetical protein JWM47_4424 [Acidimicrobiales bacterium]|nr:hypothetical protein [Acidimicrobiales bacterium]
MYEPRDVARSMIDRAETLQCDVTNLKLQKLLYIAHGVMLAMHDRPLVDEPFSAWKYGPVIEPLYHDLKVFGADSIKSSDFYIQRWGKIPEHDQDAYAAIDAVLGHFGSRSGANLIQWSHAPNGPWHAVYEDNTKNLTIEDEEIKSYFKRHVLKAPAPASASA